MRKGITPIIAIIILLLITVSLAGLAWTYLSGILTGRTEGSFIIPTNGILCDEDASGNTHIRVLIQNTGVSKNLRASDFIIAEVDGTDVSGDLNGTISIKPKESKFILDTQCGGTSCGSGVKKVRLGTTATIVENYVTCP
ncbi:MAG: hypothetical protein DRP13_00470 [Candidatus Aenigmatarchaeota archaeon]|nr:MAG: hypothetical protein DRP13_00470 [Candidatus Aenigmarchaeota archaeon]